MIRADPHIAASVPVVALFGGLDGTAEPGWHGPWLEGRVARLDIRFDAEVGHLIHHLRPAEAWDTIRSAIAMGRG